MWPPAASRLCLSFRDALEGRVSSGVDDVEGQPHPVDHVTAHCLNSELGFAQHDELHLLAWIADQAPADPQDPLS